MGQESSAPTDPSSLSEEYREYIRKLRIAWFAEKPEISKDVYEVMRPEDRNRVHARIVEWDRYITPLAEAWWRERGYGVIWPDDNSEPMQRYKLETA